ncbi:uncharacterized protein CTHT_0045540 [Thermochaetoides thermophila DSM 1495]|uniref:Beta-catenin-like protein 1 N-terminal domain-containing protein n=1 Tax=Chaetomium thermophilum (strain DSM 1495 / CBS 144.50 / IMI 039719) TaxID=759272 RepID=G0S9E3_CHATD|nr:hypothetical protein CTHT_0045540 [Thermochaetoides thermophila DSM 1495]EGS20054.1 hypothetical protein CTHT_0045540 [Thermochaetoides thermophila DSM 1495]
MASIDEIFQKSGIPSKRKLEPIRDPSARPPPDDDYEEPGDDDEGRFFGGGISKTEREILDYIDTSNPAANSATADLLPEDGTLDAGSLKKLALAFEKKINRNAELRARYEDEPAKFIDSEADLDAAIKALSLLSEHPGLYPEFVKLGSAASLVSLLAHENTDIALAAVEIIGELTDEDVPATEEQFSGLVQAMMDADLVGLLVSNLQRLQEDKDEVDREGVYRVLGVVENLCSSARKETVSELGRDKSLVTWLLDRVKKEETTPGVVVSQNRQYAAEILAILVQESRENRRRLAEMDAVDRMLQLVARYRKRDPEKGGDEEEYVENLFAALTSLVDEPEGKEKFVEAEGIELILIMLKDGGKLVKPAALRLLDHATIGGGAATLGVCQRLVEAGGLKTIFTMFMKKDDARIIEHLVGIFSQMLRLLPGDSPERIRTLAKFVEKDYEKIERLMKIRRDVAAKMARVDAKIDEEKAGMNEEEREEMEDEWFSRRLDAGLFTLQTIDVILAWLVAEDDGARRKIKELLADRDETFDVIKATIQEQIDGIDIDTEEGKEMKEMLKTLVEFLQ